MNAEFTRHLEDYYQAVAKENILISYAGPFNFKVSANLLSVFKKHLNNFHIQLLLKKKIYNVMVEVMDNVCKHNQQISDSDNNHSPFPAIFILEKSKSDFLITTGNLINQNKVDTLINIFNKINAMSKSELAERYKNIIINGINAEESEAGIGFLDIALKSGNKLEYQFKKTDENSAFYIFKVRINH